VRVRVIVREDSEDKLNNVEPERWPSIDTFVIILPNCVHISVLVDA
jgi:hypothetical protein